MLYLEDYLEMIELLPQELRDRFTEMRELDLQVQNSMDSLEKQVKIFFSNAKKMKPQERDAEYESIRNSYYKALEDADEKVQLGNQMYDLVDRCLRRLDQELHKFKMELEADHKGITEVLEKRSLEMDQPSQNSSQKENRYSFNTSRIYHEKRRDSNSSSASIEKKHAVEKQVLPSSNVLEPRPLSTSGSGSLTPTPVPVSTPNVSYSLGHIGAGGNAIAAAASQAIAATQQMQQGRRTASLKASYEAINIGTHAHEFSIGKELAGAAQTAIAAIQETTKKQKKKTTIPLTPTITPVAPSPALPTIPAPVAPSPPPPQPQPPPVPPPPPVIIQEETPPMLPNDAMIDPNAQDPDWTYDPNEPRYCICDQVSYGDMVACDNKDCPFEWFHYPCVGITAPPKGKWYCPQCTSSMKRRGPRKN